MCLSWSQGLPSTGALAWPAALAGHWCKLPELVLRTGGFTRVQCSSNELHAAQGVRHMSFTLNQSLIEDLRDLITTQRRAFQRQGRLEPRGGNNYAFLVARPASAILLSAAGRIWRRSQPP